VSTLHDIAEPALLAEMVQGGFIRSTSSFDGSLVIWNYTQRAQYGQMWNPATLACRGLITTRGTNEVIARPFAKFFNLNEMAEVPEGPVWACEKLDGSLGIIYPTPDGPAVATRGAFTSSQARWATTWLRDRPEFVEYARAAFDEGHTPLVEIVYPGNRIVLDYGERAELVYLASIDIDTGRDAAVASMWPGSAAGVTRLASREHVAAMLDECDGEGFVIVFADGTRAKVKTADYLRLHKLLCGVNERRVWELLAAGQGLDEMLTAVPDEFHRWVQSVADGLGENFAAIDGAARDVIAEMPRHWTRKQQAEVIVTTAWPSVVFAMLDGKDHADAIWRMLKPAAGAAFRTDPDEPPSPSPGVPE
jgi:RNA ligase